MDLLELEAKQKEEAKQLYLPKTIELANSLIQAFIKKNNIVALKLAIVLSGAREQIKYVENTVTFEVESLCKILNISKRDLSRNINKALETKFKYVTKEGNAGATVPIHSYEYKKRNKYIEIEISSLAKEIFTELQKGAYSFAKDIDPINLLSLKHKHSIRMALLLEQILNYSGNAYKRKKLTLAQLNNYFGVNYANYYEFERKILKPVKEELDNNSKITFLYEFRDKVNGTGRPTIEHIQFDLKVRDSYQARLEM